MQDFAAAVELVAQVDVLHLSMSKGRECRMHAWFSQPKYVGSQASLQSSYGEVCSAHPRCCIFNASTVASTASMHVHTRL